MGVEAFGKMIEIKSDDVKEAVVKKLIEVFPGMAVYKEAVTTPSYPHFFVYQTGVVDTEERSGYHILSYSMDVRYREASDPSTVSKLQQRLDNVGFALLLNFDLLDFNDSLIRCVDKSLEKNDGVLHFMCTFTPLAKKKNNVENIKQMKMKMEVEKL